MTNRTQRNTPLLTGISQFEVDFVIPRIGVDLPMGIDPFLLFKSRYPEFQALHNQILDVFRFGIDLIKNQRDNEVRELFQFPEVSEIGLGYTIPQLDKVGLSADDRTKIERGNASKLLNLP